MFFGLFENPTNLAVLNFFQTTANIWSLTYFVVLFYILFVFSAILYLVANIKDFTQYNAFLNSTLFNYVSGLDLLVLLVTPIYLITLVNFAWISPDLTSWFGHLILTSFQIRVTYLILFVFFCVWLSYSSSFYYASQEIYDYTTVTYSFCLWIIFLFYSNNIFTVIFFIEILSTIIMLLIITSVFSSTYFYNNLNLSRHSYFNQSTPFAFLQTIMFFFWISLISSLNLFVFLTLFYLKLFTFDWYTVEYVFYYLISVSDLKSIFTLTLVWMNFLFCIFLKCGLVPFYFWKPIFFKGVPLHALFFYIVFFYFFIFYFFTYFFIIYLSELFYFNIFVNIIMLMSGLLMLVFILCESYYIKAFLAMSSILNTLFVFLALNSFSLVDYIFIL